MVLSCYTTYAVEGLGEALPSRDLYFLVWLLAKPATTPERNDLGGLAALQTSRLAGDRVTRVMLLEFNNLNQVLNIVLSELSRRVVSGRVGSYDRRG
jgi:hypothetical protein